MQKTNNKLALSLLMLAFYPISAQETELFRKQSQYQTIMVKEVDGVKCMYFNPNNKSKNNVGEQGCQTTNRNEVYHHYCRQMSLTFGMAPKAKKALVIGLGVGVIPRMLERLPNIDEIDVVELDPMVEAVSNDFFNYADNRKINTHIEDGRVFVKQKIKEGKKYDLIYLDAFTSDYVPEHLMTREFYQDIKAIMKSGSVLSSNTYEASLLKEHESNTYLKEFGGFFQSEMGNRIIFAMKDFSKLKEIVDEVPNYADKFDQEFTDNGYEMSQYLKSLKPYLGKLDESKVLTDGHSPANLLISLYEKENALGAKVLKIKNKNPALIVILSVIVLFSFQVALVALFRKHKKNQFNL